MMQSLMDRRSPRTSRDCLYCITAVALLIILGLTGASFAQNARVSASSDSVTVGDRFQLHIAADYPDGMTPVLPDLSRGDTTLGDLTIIKQIGFPQRSTSRDGRTDSITYEVATFALDTARVPPIDIAFAEEGDTVRASSEPLDIKVGSLVRESAEDIRGITPLATFPQPLWPWVLGGGLALALAAAALYLLLRKSEDEEAVPEARNPDIPPYAEAITRLQELEATDLETLETPKPFFIELSDLLRSYISRTTAVHARELTTYELVDRLDRTDGPPKNIYTRRRIGRINTILRLADLVKFADRKPGPDDSRSALDATRKTIESLHRSAEENVKRTEARTRVKESADRQADG